MALEMGEMPTCWGKSVLSTCWKSQGTNSPLEPSDRDLYYQHLEYTQKDLLPGYTSDLQNCKKVVLFEAMNFVVIYYSLNRKLKQASLGLKNKI